MSGESGYSAARSRALAVLRIRSIALVVALLPAAVAIVLAFGGPVGVGHAAVRWTVAGVAALVLLVSGAVAAVIARARPALSPTVPVAEHTAPDLYRMVRDLAVRLGVPEPSGVELTPDCDSWLEDRPGGGGRAAPVLIVGSPFMWWMRVTELRALLAPVVAGTGPSADTDIAAARRFLRGLDAAAGVAAGRGGRGPGWPAYAFLGRSTALMLRGCRVHAAKMEQAVAAFASERAQSVDYGLRIVAQEQVGLAYAGWDRLLTRVALPAWQTGRWPSRLNAGVVAALTELSRRDRLAEGFESRLGERPACDLLEDPGTVDEAASLLAARLFHGGPKEHGPDWKPVDWESYPEEVVDRIWRSEAARLHRVLDETSSSPEEQGRPTLSRVLERLTAGGSEELATRVTARLDREEAARAASSPPSGEGPEVYRLRPPRTARELLTEHVTAMVCCAAVDTAGAVPGLDWLDGPALMVNGARRADLSWPVLRLVENGDAGPLRSWLAAVGVLVEKPVRLG